MKLDDIKRLSALLPIPPSPQNYALVQEHLRTLGLDPENLYQELEMSDPYVQAHQDSSYGNTLLQLHSHSFSEFLCCRSGGGIEYLLGTERYRLQPGDLVFVPPGVSHRPILPEEMTEPYVRDVIWLSPGFLELLRLIYPRQDTAWLDKSFLLRTAHTGWSYICELFRSTVAEAEQQRPGWQGVVAGNAICLLSHLLRAVLDQKTVPPQAELPQLPDRILAYIEGNLSQRLTLDAVAAHFYVSPSTVRQGFRKKMGISFYRYVTQRRLIAAKILICGGQPLEAVGTQVGFSDYSTFFRAFKQEFGISPRQFRKRSEESGKSAL